MYSIEELIQLKQAGFSAEEILSLSNSGKKEETQVETPTPAPVPKPETKDESQMNEMLEAFKTSMNEQMEAFKEAIKISNINHDSFDNGKQTTVEDVVASIIRPNGPRKDSI